MYGGPCDVTSLSLSGQIIRFLIADLLRQDSVRNNYFDDRAGRDGLGLTKTNKTYLLGDTPSPRWIRRWSWGDSCATT